MALCALRFHARPVCSAWLDRLSDAPERGQRQTAAHQRCGLGPTMIFSQAKLFLSIQ